MTATAGDKKYQLLENDIDDNNTKGESHASQSNSNYGAIPDSQEDRKSSETVLPIHLALLTILSAIGGFLFGYDTGVVSGAMLALRKVFELNYVWQELIVSITIAAAVVSAGLSGPLNDLLGRKKVILISSLIFVAGSLVMGFSNSKELLLVGRMIVGFGIGLASMTSPMYISECTPVDVRGKLTVINNVFITIGQMIASIIDGIFFMDKKNGWRFMLGLAAIPAAIQFIGLLFVPESPRWLIVKGKDKEARKVLARIRTSTDEELNSEVDAIRTGHEQSVRSSQVKGQQSSVILRILQHPPTRRALILGCGLQMFQQLVGINTVMYYSATIVQMAGVRDPHTAVWIAAGAASVNCVAGLFSILLVDRIGRRKLTLSSLIGVFISLIVLAVGFLVITYSSPPISVHVPPPADVTSSCDRLTRCSDCANRQDCGFCYSLPPLSSSLLAVNGSCLPTRVGYGTRSSYGPCNTIGLNNATNHHWTYLYCPTSYAWTAICGVLLYLVCFSIGMGPMAWTVNAEIYPTWARSTGVAASTCVNWIFNLLISMTFLSLTVVLTRSGAFWLYAGFAFFGICFLLITLPETKGKTLEEVEQLFEKPWNLFCCKV